MGYMLDAIRGDTLSFAFELEYDSDPQEVDMAHFSVKKNVEDSVPIIHKSLWGGITLAGTQDNSVYYVVRASPEDTEKLAHGQYYYDVSIELNGDTFTILHGILKVENDITR